MLLQHCKTEVKSKHKKQGYGAIDEFSDKGTEVQEKQNFNILPFECTQVLI